MTRKRKATARVGVSLLLGVLGFLPSAFAAKHDRKPEAIVSGTVFNDSGFALPHAQVLLRSAPQAGEGDPGLKHKGSSDGRGEFSFRVPAEQMHYSIRVKAKGFQEADKTAEVRGEERVDVTFRMRRESK